MDCFLVPQRDLRCFYAGAVARKSALFWETHATPLKTEISTLSRNLIGVFTLRIAHIVHYLYNSTKGIVNMMVEKDLNAFLTFVQAPETVN